MKLSIGSVGFALLLLVAGCSTPPKPPPLLPGIAIFLAAHPDMGKAKSSESMPDWSDGQRMRVRTDDNGHERSLLFYLKNGQVVTVYEDGGGVRTEIWRETP